jgi:hypothetical protein
LWDRGPVSLKQSQVVLRDRREKKKKPQEDSYDVFMEGDSPTKQ